MMTRGKKTFSKKDRGRVKTVFHLKLREKCLEPAAVPQSKSQRKFDEASQFWKKTTWVGSCG